MDIEDIRYPVKEDNLGGIWFAGEAMSSRYNGYLHAAYHSGTETAEEVRKFMGYALAFGLNYSVKAFVATAIVAFLTA